VDAALLPMRRVHRHGRHLLDRLHLQPRRHQRRSVGDRRPKRVEYYFLFFARGAAGLRMTAVRASYGW
jgi:hypothetical protein